MADGNVNEAAAVGQAQNGVQAGTALVPVPAPSPVTRDALWGTDDPTEIVERATKVANALKPILTGKQMTQRIGRKEHVKIEGWQTLGSLTGVMAVDPRTREVPWPSDDRLNAQLREIRDAGYAFGYEATYTARTLSGALVGGASQTCRRTEEDWRTRPKYEGGNGRRRKVAEKIVDDFALEGMALTRAQSRCFASPLRFVVELAGYSGTPAEEVDQGHADDRGRQAPPRPRAKAAPRTTAHERKPSVAPITGRQKGAIHARCAAGDLSEAEASAIRVWWAAKAGVRHFDRMPAKEASKLIRALREDGSGAQELLDEIHEQAEVDNAVAVTLVERLKEADDA